MLLFPPFLFTIFFSFYWKSFPHLSLILLNCFFYSLICRRWYMNDHIFYIETMATVRGQALLWIGYWDGKYILYAFPFFFFFFKSSESFLSFTVFFFFLTFSICLCMPADFLSQVIINLLFVIINWLGDPSTSFGRVARAHFSGWRWQHACHKTTGCGISNFDHQNPSCRLCHWRYCGVECIILSIIT